MTQPSQPSGAPVPTEVGREQALFLQVARVLADTLDLEASLQAIADTGAELIGAETGAVYLVEPNQRVYLGATVPPLSPDMPDALRWASLGGHPHLSEAVSSGETVVLSDTGAVELTPAEREVVEVRGLRTLVYLPLSHEGETVAVLILGSTSGTWDISQRELELCRALADQVTLGVQNALLHARLQEHAARLEEEVAERKRAEEARRASEERFRALFEQAGDYILVLEVQENGDVVIVDANQRAHEVHGYAREEFLGHSVLDLDRAMSDREGEDLLRKVEEGETALVETVHRRKDGTEFHVEASLTALDLGDGRRYLLSVERDITERKRSEARLLERMEFERSLLAATPVAVVTLARDGTVLSWNPSAERTFGWSADEAVGHRLPIVAENDLPDFTDILGRVWGGETVHSLERTRVSRSGEQLHVSISAAPIRDSMGRVEALVETIQDITEQVTTARSLDWSREEYRLLFTNAISGVAVHEIVLDEQGEPVDYVFLDVNPSFERLTGLKATEVVGRRVTEVIPGITQTDLLARYGAVAFTGEPETFQDYVEPLDKHFIIHAYRVAEGRFATAFEDVTEQVRSEEGRVALERQLHEAQKMEAVARLAGGIAHDFNNMLAVILSASEMALPEVEPDTTLHQDLMSVLEAAQRSAELTRQLLAFSRRQVIHPATVNLNASAVEQERILQRLLGEEVTLDLDLSSRLWNVFIDPSQVDQIITNLVVNARDAIEGAEGRITLSTANVGVEPDPTVEDFPVEGGEYVCLSVSDNGVGMAPEVLAHIFEPFYTTKAMGKGTGLGLSTVYGIVKQNEGVIRVRSEIGLGTTFEVHLPRHRGEAEQAVSSEGAPIRGSETILVVEDEEAILSLAERFLQTLGYQVLTASTPTSALDVVNAHDGPLDLLLTDVVLPEMNGRQLQQRLLELRPEMRTAFMSGYDADVVAHRGVVEEGVAFIQKPFTMHTLTQRLREILDADQ